jgi:hypothetical protein
MKTETEHTKHMGCSKNNSNRKVYRYKHFNKKKKRIRVGGIAQ